MMVVIRRLGVQKKTQPVHLYSKEFLTTRTEGIPLAPPYKNSSKIDKGSSLFVTVRFCGAVCLQCFFPCLGFMRILGSPVSMLNQSESSRQTAVVSTIL